MLNVPLEADMTPGFLIYAPLTADICFTAVHCCQQNLHVAISSITLISPWVIKAVMSSGLHHHQTISHPCVQACNYRAVDEKCSEEDTTLMDV